MLKRRGRRLGRCDVAISGVPGPSSLMYVLGFGLRPFFLGRRGGDLMDVAISDVPGARVGLVCVSLVSVAVQLACLRRVGVKCV